MVCYLQLLGFTVIFHLPSDVAVCSSSENIESYMYLHVQIQSGGQGVRNPPEKSQNIGFLCNIGPDPLKKTQCLHSMLGHHQHSSETPIKWCFAGGPMMARL